MKRGVWRAERSRDGEWIAAKTVREDFGATVAKVRKRRRLGIPRDWALNEAQAYVNGLVRKGELE